MFNLPNSIVSNIVGEIISSKNQSINLEGVIIGSLDYIVEYQFKKIISISWDAQDF
jgi:hypothetical protein